MKSSDSSRGSVFPHRALRQRSTSSEVSQTFAEMAVLRAFLQNPKRTGAVWSSSASLSKTLVDNARVASADAIVELGAGTGVVTEHIQSSKSKGSRLISLELDPQLAATAAQRCPEVHVVNGNVVDMQCILNALNMPVCDAIVSCIPWSNLDAQSQSSMLDVVESSLSEGGTFVAFAYVHSAFLPRARSFLAALRQRFNVVGSSDIIWSNLPPAIVYTAHGKKRCTACADQHERAAKVAGIDSGM